MVGMEFLEQFDIKYARHPATGVDTISVYRPHEGFEAHLGDPAWKPVKGVFMPARLLGIQIGVALTLASGVFQTAMSEVSQWS